MSLFGKTYDDEYAKPIQLKTNNSSLFGQTYNPNIDRSAVVPVLPVAPLPVKSSPTKTSAPLANYRMLDNISIANPIVGENLFLTNAFPIKQDDSMTKKGLKGAGNFLLSALTAPGEALRKASLQGGSLLSGNGIQELPKNTSFVNNILPQGASNAVNSFRERNPILGGIAGMAIEGAVDPTMYIGGGTIKRMVTPKSEQGMAVLKPLPNSPRSSVSSPDWKPPLQSRTVQRGVELGPLQLNRNNHRARQAELNEVFKDYPIGSVDTPVARKTLQEGIDSSLGIGRRSGITQADIENKFGGPLKTFKKSTDAQDSVAEITKIMTKKANDVTKTLRQMDKDTPIETTRSKIQKMGGIRPSKGDLFEEQQIIPTWIKNSNGRPLDEVADELGMTSEELRAVISSEAFKPRNYADEAFKVLRGDPEYQALESTLQTLKGQLPRKRTIRPNSQDIVYHGTNKDFKEFDMSQNKPSTLYGPAFYFTDSLESAKRYSTSYRGNTGNPRVINAKLKHDKLWDYSKDKITPQQYEEVFNYNGDYPKISEPTTLGQLSGINDITKGLKELGYNGFKISEKDGSNTYAVFNPEQITQIPKPITKSDIKIKPREITPQPFGNSDKFKPQPIQPQRTTLSGTLPVDAPIGRPVRQLTPIQREPKQWTNREGLPNQPAPIRPMSEHQTLKDVLASRESGVPIRPISRQNTNTPLRPPNAVEQRPIRPIESTVGIEMPVIRSNANSVSMIEIPRTRSMAAEIEGQGVSSSAPLRNPEPIRPPAEPPNRVFANDDGTIRPQINREPKKGKTFTEMAKDSRTHFVDDLAPLDKVERAVYGNLQSAESSFYKQARLYRGNPEQAAEFVRSRLAPIITSIEKQGYSVKDIGDYALAIHARDVNAKGINSGFSNERIANTINKHGTPEMEAARKELLKVNNELLESLGENGVIEKSLVTALKEKWPNYMSLSRAFDDEKVEFASEMSKALANASSPLQRLKGSGKDVIDPIESMIKNIYKTTSTVDRNKIASQLKGLAENDPSGQIVRKLAVGEEKSRLNTVYAMESGKKVYYEVQPDVYKALMGLDKDSANKFIKIFQKPASLLRAGATLTPEFSLRNPLRDIPAAYAVSNSGLNPIRDIPMALFDIFKSRRGGQTLYNQYLKDNAGYGNLISTDRKVLQDAMTDVLKEPTSKKFVNIVSGKSAIRFLRAIADVSENATKLGEYRAALRSGASSPEAAYRARDIMDFGRGGASIREFNKISAFLNANIQGKSKIYRAIKEDPVGVTARAFKTITLPTIGAFLATKYLANDVQRERIENAPGWMTSTFWLIPVPGTDQVARFPKPFDFAPIFANAPERAMKYIFDNDPEAFEGFAKESLASWSIPMMITGLIPMLEGVANYSLFRRGPIIPQRESGLNYSDQYDINTTGTAKFLAKGASKITGEQGAMKNFSSPRIMDNTIKGLTAGLGTYATSFVDYVAKTSGMVEKKNKPVKNLSDRPLLKAFLVSESMSGKSMEKMYREKETLTKNKNSLKLESPKAKFPEEKRLKDLNEATSEISDISKDIRKIENDRSMDPLVKREKINAQIAKRNALSKGVMK